MQSEGEDEYDDRGKGFEPSTERSREPLRSGQASTTGTVGTIARDLFAAHGRPSTHNSSVTDSRIS